MHRPAGSSVEFRRVVERLSIPAGSFVVSAARHIAAGRVTLEQLELLGRYERRSLIARNAERHVKLGFFEEADRGTYSPSEDLRSASRFVLDLQARAAEAAWAGTTDLAEVATSAGAVVAAVRSPVSTPAFAAQRADHDVTPDTPAGQLLAFVTELRYLRSDLHAHALAAHGLSGPKARDVDRSWKSGALTGAARRARDDAQALTERLSVAALDTAPADARRTLFDALEQLPGEDPRPVSER